MNTKLCKKCNTLKSEDKFTTFKLKGVTKIRHICATCYKIANKEYYDKNAEKIRDRSKKWHHNNSEKASLRIKNYYKNNKDKFNKKENYNPDIKSQYDKDYRNRQEVKERRKIRAANRMKSDPEFKIMRNIRIRLFYALRGSRKPDSTLKALGCSPNQLRKHLESKFVAGMTWDNYGSDWHIDHIKPLKSFNLTNLQEYQQAAHYTNLQPLWAIDNLRKKDKLLTEVQTA